MNRPRDLPFDADWVASYFAEVDRMDPSGVMAWYADDGRFRFAGQPPVVGKPAIGAALSGFYSTIRSMRHRRTGTWIDPAAHSGVFEAEVDFVTASGRELTIPAVSVLRLGDGLVHDFRFVMDAAPLADGDAL